MGGISWADMTDDDIVCVISDEIVDETTSENKVAVNDDGFMTVVKQKKTIRKPEYIDRMLNCRFCLSKFNFSAIKQAEFVNKGWSEPKSCIACNSSKRKSYN
jgi:hypothetical protein